MKKSYFKKSDQNASRIHYQLNVNHANAKKTFELFMCLEIIFESTFDFGIYFHAKKESNLKAGSTEKVLVEHVKLGHKKVVDKWNAFLLPKMT